MPTGVMVPKETWKLARQAIENGELYPDCAARLGIKLTTLRRRAAKEKWESPSRRIMKKAEVEGDTRAPEISKVSRIGENEAESQLQLSRINEHREKLIAAAKTGPEAYLKALESWGQDAIAEGIPDIPAPRTLGELKTVVDILEKARKMTNADADKRGIRSLPSLSRGHIIDADPIPEVEGFRI